MILVVGHEKLNVEMQRTYGNRMTVVKIPKSGGVCICSFLASSIIGSVCSLLTCGRQVVELDVHYRQRVHAQQVHTYFYGQTTTLPPGLSITSIGDADFDGHLAPSSSVIPFGELSFLRIGESKKNPISLRRPLRTSLTLPPFFFSYSRIDGTVICSPDWSDTYRE